MDKSAELVGKRGLAPEFLVDWIADKRGLFCHLSSEEELSKCHNVTGKLCCIYMKYDEEKSSPSWHPYRYQVRHSKNYKFCVFVHYAIC